MASGCRGHDGSVGGRALEDLRRRRQMRRASRTSYATSPAKRPGGRNARRLLPDRRDFCKKVLTHGGGEGRLGSLEGKTGGLGSLGRIPRRGWRGPRRR